jgi:hypothetical protein
MVKLWEKVLVVGPSGFEIWLEVGRPRVWIENPEGPTAMTFTYINCGLIFFCLHPTAFVCLSFFVKSGSVNAIICLLLLSKVSPICCLCRKQTYVATKLCLEVGYMFVIQVSFESF